MKFSNQQQNKANINKNRFNSLKFLGLLLKIFGIKNQFGVCLFYWDCTLHYLNWFRSNYPTTTKKTPLTPHLRHDHSTPSPFAHSNTVSPPHSHESRIADGSLSLPYSVGGFHLLQEVVVRSPQWSPVAETHWFVFLPY